MMMNKKALSLAAAVIFSLALVGAEETALSIVRKVDANERNASSRMEFTMSIKPADGSEPRVFSLRALENADGDSMIEFSAPKTVRGMRILSREKNSWVFFPSTGRVRKIGGSSRSGSVQGIGGDFSYDDLGGGSWEEDYEFTLIGTSAATWELEGRRKTADAAYDAVRLTVDRSTFLVVKASFSLAKEGGFYKELVFSDFRDFESRRRAGKMVMKNVKKGSSTEVLLDKAEFDMPIEDRNFDPARFNQ